MPAVDNTDVYAFTSPDAQDTVTFIANWAPFSEPNGGPNFYPWAEGAHYDINIDSDGDAIPNITYRWIFNTDDRRGTDTFLYNNGPVETLDDENLLFRQTYDLLEIRDGKARVLLDNQLAAPSNVGPASMPATRTSSTATRHKRPMKFICHLESIRGRGGSTGWSRATRRW